jgi:hypothetical protein
MAITPFSNAPDVLVTVMFYIIWFRKKGSK